MDLEVFIRLERPGRDKYSSLNHSLSLKTNKLECLSMAGSFSLVKYLWVRLTGKYMECTPSGLGSI